MCGVGTASGTCKGRDSEPHAKRGHQYVSSQVLPTWGQASISSSYHGSAVLIRVVGLVILAGLMLGGSYGVRGDGDSRPLVEVPVVRGNIDGQSAAIQGQVQQQGRGSSGEPAAYVLRIYGLATDGQAEPEAAVVPVSTPTPIAEAVATSAPWSIEDIICAHPWPCWEAISVAWCESTHNPGAYNASSGASGLFQVVPYWHSWRLRPGESLFDPVVNARIAWEIWSGDGGSWRQWVCQP